MKRNIDMNEISDGKLYKSYSLVKIGCRECEGCSECCRDVGNTITLDPYDIYELSLCLGITFEEMLSRGYIELGVVDEIILPNLVTPCSFLNEAGRCSIHKHRPGFCRLYPLGRIYNDNDFDYFLQVHECPFPNKTKVKVENWLDIPDLNTYEQYIIKWHFFLKDVTAKIREKKSESFTKAANMSILNNFFIKPYNTNQNFYEQFDERI